VSDGQVADNEECLPKEIAALLERQMPPSATS
jgi:hypothetical protein